MEQRSTAKYIKPYSADKIFFTLESEFVTHRFLPGKRHAKVNDLEIKAVGLEEEYILRFEVAMCNVVIVAVVDRLYKLPEDTPGINFCELISFHQLLEQFSSFA
jgi:hypothetical protein